MLRFLFIMGITSCILSPCDERTFTLDAVEDLCFGSGITATCVDRSSIVYAEVARMENEGWSCPSENLYNAFGRQFGTRFSCSICE